MADLMTTAGGANVPFQKFIKEYRTWCCMILPLKTAGTGGFSFAQHSKSGESRTN
jgi:hypothetical protein